jgi:hypothetical protein
MCHLLSTVHLGHVAADMEKQGKATDRGNMNRQVAEHHATVIDLAQFRADSYIFKNRPNY